VKSPRTSIATELLVIGYGNELRGDDGVGPRVAETVASWELKGVQTIACPLLTPELADALSQARVAVFVDAAVNGPEKVQLRKVQPSESSQIMAHAANPPTMLALARDVFGQAPEAWMLTIPVSKFGFTQELSLNAQSGIAAALQKVHSFCHSLQLR
jgi:hydrogenase maturation protease